MSLIKGLISFLYPNLCKSCEVSLVNGEDHYCLHCELNFMEIKDSKDKQTEIAQLFWGKAKIKNIHVPFQFLKKEKLQLLIHEFKYNNNRKLAIELGDYLAEKLQLEIQEESAVTFVPMHLQKQKKRGYNQAELLAKGFALNCGLPLIEMLERVEETDTQTDKGVFERFENMEDRFKLIISDKIKHAYLIDDVITTGATLVSCANELINNGIGVTIVCLAYRGLED